MKSLFDLRADECHFILGEGYQCYCGQPAARRSYCENHYALVYVQAPFTANERHVHRIHALDDRTILRLPREVEVESVDEVLNPKNGKRDR
ncbi:MAG: hypothetical protein ACK52I_20835 [Pseudomonadota bacterium]|jgi:hypothetical protein